MSYNNKISLNLSVDGDLVFDIKNFIKIVEDIIDNEILSSQEAS